MLMAACQSQLRTPLLYGVKLAVAMAPVNADLRQRSEASKPIIIVCGVIDAQQQMVELVDAGHGFCVLARPRNTPVRVETTPGFPLGVVGATVY